MIRLLSGALLLVFAIGVVWFAPPLVFLLVAEVLLALAVWEYVHLASATGLVVPAVATGAAALLTSLSVTASALGGALPVPPATLDIVLMSALVALGGLTLAGWRGEPDALARASVALFPCLYLALPIGAMVAVRATRGPAVLFLLMLTVIVSDTAQYYTGRAFGRRPLAPAVSPKKTIEGAVGGFVFGPLTLAGLGRMWLPGVPTGWLVVLGLATVALGIAGDLFESMLKRSAGVKDSSSLIPGHGGVLDRIDALLFAAPVYYIVLKYL